MSTADVLLARLDGVRATGPDRWVARCPAHEDRRPSLSIREIDDRVLVHDFGGCTVEAVLTAAGLTFDDLFPPRLSQRNHREARPFVAIDVVRCIATELTIVVTAAGNLRQGIALTRADHARLLTAASRLTQAVELAHGH